MRECNTKENLAKCNCSYESCKRKGICCECLRHHRRSGELPACFFPDEVEKTYNRSIDNFIKTYQQRGQWW